MKNKLYLLLIILVIAATWLFKTLHTEMDRVLPTSETQFITLSHGTSVYKLAKNLEQRSLISHSYWLKAYSRLYPEKVAVKAGTYQLLTTDSLTSLLAKMVAGKEHQFSITFIEGTTLKEWLVLLSQAPNTKQTDKALTISDITEKLAIEDQNPEGWFFPDTYAYTAGDTVIAILGRAHQKMKKTLEEEWQKRATELPYKSAYEALIMASIIEKETSVLSEQPVVSGVFINRLHKRMRLQTDPTVIYGLGDRFDGNITKAHLREKTAYNTYRINGLPPTPIAMPGISAIKAAMHPAPTDYYYFVGKGDGTHYFSSTLAEHNKAVKQFQLNQK